MSMLEEDIREYHRALAREYQQLSNLTVLSSCQEVRLSYILDLAVQEPLLDKLIQKVEMAILSPEDKKVILNQQAKMREYLGISIKIGLPIDICLDEPLIYDQVGSLAEQL